MSEEEPATSFAEQAATWLQGAEFVVYVATGVALLFYQFPAYKRFRTQALLLLVISSGLALFVTVFDETIGKHGTPDPNQWWNYYFCRELTWLTAVVLATVGALLFLRDYARLASAAPRESSSASPPPTDSSPVTDSYGTLKLDDLPAGVLAREAFDDRTKHRWTREPLEMFRCVRCSTIFLGLPDCHIAFPNPADFGETISYNRPQAFRCPRCCTTLLASPADTASITVADIAASAWSWLLAGGTRSNE